MTQEELFHEDVYEALKACIARLEGAKKFASTHLWPDKPADKAGELLLNCLNRNRPEKLDPEQVIKIFAEARRVGCHIGLYFVADACGYERPSPVDPEDEKARLQREFIESVKEQQAMLKRMERL